MSKEKKGVLGALSKAAEGIKSILKGTKSSPAPHDSAPIPAAAEQTAAEAEFDHPDSYYVRTYEQIGEQFFKLEEAATNFIQSNDYDPQYRQHFRNHLEAEARRYIELSLQSGTITPNDALALGQGVGYVLDAFDAAAQQRHRPPSAVDQLMDKLLAGDRPGLKDPQFLKELAELKSDFTRIGVAEVSSSDSKSLERQQSWSEAEQQRASQKSTPSQKM